MVERSLQRHQMPGADTRKVGASFFRGADVLLVHHGDGQSGKNSAIICHYPSLSFILMILRAGRFNGISFSEIIRSQGLLIR